MTAHAPRTKVLMQPDPGLRAVTSSPGVVQMETISAEGTGTESRPAVTGRALHTAGLAPRTREHSHSAEHPVPFYHVRMWQGFVRTLAS